MDVTTRQLRIFVAIAELGSFSKAGARLRTAQPALSQAVRELEARLAVRLFDRTTRRVELTEGGREFQRAALKILEDIDVAVRQAGEFGKGQRGRITVAAPPFLAAVALPQVIAAFKKTNPAVRVLLLDVSTDQIIDAVRRGDADCGVGTFPPGVDGIENARLSRDTLMAFMPATDAVGSPRTVGWTSLRDRPLITLTRDSGIRRLVEIGFESAQMPFVPAYEVKQITTALALVEAGLGVAVLPAYARAAKTTRKLVNRTLSGPTMTRDIDLIHVSGRPVSPLTSAFQAALRKHLFV
jgi:DNA-binding transcriptional LysR family regulator